MVYFVPPKPAPRKCRIGCTENAFPKVGSIIREKLFRYAKYGRPGVKTEYNEKFRDWNQALSKYDSVSVSMYSQKMLNRTKNKVDGYPCVCFTGTFDGKNVEKLKPFDPYSDEWFDKHELFRSLKAEPVIFHERPKGGRTTAKIMPHDHHGETDVELVQSKMEFINDQIGRKASNPCLRTVASAASVSTVVHPPKTRQAWGCNSAVSVPESYQPKKATGQKSYDLDEDSSDIMRIRDLHHKVNNTDSMEERPRKKNPVEVEIKQHKALDPSTARAVPSNYSVRRVHR